MTEPIPDRRWTTRRKVVATGAVVAVVGLIIGAVAWRATRPETVAERPAAFEPAEETTAPPVPSVLGTETAPKASSSPSAGAPGSPAQAAPGKTADAQTVRAPRVAFRLGNTLYVAKEDGSDPVRVAPSGDWPYALSPDGAMLASFDDGRLRLVTVATGVAIDVADAEAGTPVWSPDSSEVNFIRLGSSGEMAVWRSGADGTGLKRLTDGSEVSISPDGWTKAVRIDSAEGRGAVLVSRNGTAFKPIEITGYPTSVAALNDAIIVGLAGGSDGPCLVKRALVGTDLERIAGAPAGDPTAVWGGISVSPDGTTLAIEAVGDDGYSRVSLLPVGADGMTSLGERKDTYFHSWDAAGTGLFVVEGNSFQGESTQLFHLQATGGARATVMTGAR